MDPNRPQPTQRYRSLPLTLLWNGGGVPLQGLRAAWWISLPLCIALGLATVVFQWSGLVLHFGGVDLFLTVYPPLTLCTLWVLCFGFWWGAVPAYLSTLTLALYAGMAPGWALVFALSNPLSFFVLAVAYRAVQLAVPPRSVSTALFYVTVAFISAVFGATGSFIWSYTGQVDPQAAFAIWQGWWLGGFLQTVLLAGPLLALFGPRLMRWRDTRLPGSEDALMARWKLFVASLVGVGGVLAFLWVSFFLGRRVWLSLPAPAGPQEFQRLLTLVHESTLAVYWIITVLTLAVLFLGHRFFMHWTRELERRIEENQHLQARLQEQAVRDPLTGLYNRRHLQHALPLELQRSQRSGQPVAVVVLDLDHFKLVNDRHGHAMGDRVLKALADLMRTHTRSVDICSRFGGEEFCLVLVGASAPQALERLAELRRRYAALVIDHQGQRLQGLSYSAGVAVYPGDGETDDDLLSAADHALYRAKAGGRDRVCLASGD